MAARSHLRAFTNGVRQLISVQLLIAIFAVALAGWTLGVTNQLIRERNQLRERVVQLEQAMADNGLVAPPQPARVDVRAAGDDLYPPALESYRQAGSAEQPDLRTLIGGLFGPAPAMGVVVLHVRSETDRAAAEAIAASLASGDLRALVNVMPASDARAAGYFYYDGRQSGAAAALVTRVHDAARTAQLSAWSAQLRGLALPAEGEYTAERLDVVLPALPAAPAN
jgi:hypothetical protein